MRLILRRLRGALGNAAVWGLGWFPIGLILILGTSLFGRRPSLTTEVLRTALMGAAGIAVAGAIAGGVFSAYIAANFRNKSVGDLNPARFALGGSLVTICLVLTVIYVGSLFSDWPLFLGDLVAPLLIYGSIGGVTGYGSIKLAQRALPATDDVPKLDRSLDALAP